MKARLYILLIVVTALATVLIGSCTKIQDPEDDGWTELAGDRPVSFSSSLAAPATKATTTLPNNTTFGVFAFYQEGTPSSAGNWNNTRTPNFMFNQAVEFRLPDEYTYTPLRYWPSNEYNTITFWAYCPYTSSSVFYASNGSVYTNTSTGVPDMRFIVTDGKTDLLSSSRMSNVSRPADNTVSISFNHRLSKISINVRKQDPTSRYTVKLKTIRFDGIYQTADLRTDSWRNWSNRSNFTVYADDPTDNTDDIVLETTDYAFDGVMLIPQSLVHESAKLHVEYSISYSGILHERTNAFEMLLSDVFTSDSSAWVKKKQYTLNLTIIPDDPIEFTVSWSDWGDVYNYHITS